MQSAPPEVSQNATSIESIPESSSTASQHGLLQTNDQPSGDFLPTEVDRGCGRVLNDVDNTSVTSDNSGRGRRLNIRHTSRTSNSSQESSPGSRIEAYEKASATPRKLSDGVIFQIIPNAHGNNSSVSILDFPNEVLTHILSHLPPETLSSMSLVSHRFHKLVTTPPAWRIAFARFFPGFASASSGTRPQSARLNEDATRTEHRSFTRLSALASWRSEYILRTRLLRSVARGRPALHPSSKGNGRQGGAPSAAVVTYSSGLLYPVSHIHATFGVGLNKRQPMIVHGASEQGAVSTSDPMVGKVGSWGLGDFEAFKHFADLFIGEPEYGLGAGDLVGMPNVMDVSQPYGKLYGEACPGGRLFFTSTIEQRGRFLPTVSLANHEFGVPSVTMTGCAVTSVWIAKSEAVLKVTGGLFGCLAGFSNGVLAAYALGVNPVHDRRFAHGEPTAKWAFSPGVPIIAIIVDEKVNQRRINNRKVWATVLNALGEVFYLTEIPVRPEYKGKLSEHEMDRLAWQTGRSVSWQLIESTRRSSKADPYSTSIVDGSYSPRTSSDVSGLSKEQIVAETLEVERYLTYKPKHFRNICDGWDMRKQLVVDFAGDDAMYGGEAIFLVSCGFTDDTPSSITRVTRQLSKTSNTFSLEPYPPMPSSQVTASTTGTLLHQKADIASISPLSTPLSRTSSNDSLRNAVFLTEWRTSIFTMGHIKNVQITAVATDDSDFATLTAKEDPLLGMSGGSNSSSPIGSPMGQFAMHSSPQEIPGRRARFIAVGTSTGVVLLWNMRSTISPAVDVVNSVQPVRYLYTRSPKISSLALTALYVVHGGNDGLVQAWDPLASTHEPIRTLNSRFSDRARRRIAQAEASIQGVGNNYYAAGAIALDPDPTALRGIVSLGTHLRYWSYSAGTADAYKSRKRGQLRRRSERGSNSGTNEQRFHHTGRSVLKDYIQNEKLELENEKTARIKEAARLTGRFGTDLLGEDASEEELLAYATMLSEESFAQDEERYQQIIHESTHVGEMASGAGLMTKAEPLDEDMEEAIRLSLLDSDIASESPQTTDFDVAVKYTKKGKHKAAFGSTTDNSDAYSSVDNRDDDLEFALRLSLAEQESRMMDEDEFPSLSPSSMSDSQNKGKGKTRKL